MQEKMMMPIQPKSSLEQVSLKDHMENKVSTSDLREGLKLAETFVKKFYLD